MRVWCGSNSLPFLPVKPEKRTWRAYDTIRQLGISWWQASICVWLGQGIAVSFLVLNVRWSRLSVTLCVPACSIPIQSPQVTKYNVVHKDHHSIKTLYNTRVGSWYWYTYGINFRTYAAYIGGILFNAVGLAGAGR